MLYNSYEGKNVMSKENADLMTLMLENVIKSGTATDIDLIDRVDCAGKTGTTQNNYDKWFIGYTPYYIGGVWYGYEYPKTLSDNVCTAVWDDVMTLLHKKYVSSNELKEFDISNNIKEFEYCADSGKIATEACKNDSRGSRIESGFFVLGTQPSEYCDRHVSVEYDVVCGGIASEDCPKENIKTIGMITVDRNFPMQVYVSDAQYVWKDINGTVPDTSVQLPFFNKILPQGSFCGISRSEMQFNRFCREHFKYSLQKNEIK